MKGISRLAVLFLLVWMAAGCATVGCSVQPLKPTKALRCEMPV